MDDFFRHVEAVSSLHQHVTILSGLHRLLSD
jgi:hypothetical protein